MKSKGFVTMLILLFVSCSTDNVTEQFNNANGNDNQNNPGVLLTKIEAISTQYPTENKTILINYDSSDRVTSLSNNGELSFLVYDNGNLANVSTLGEAFNVLELYNSPYEAFEIGDVLEYDNNGNPIKLHFFDTDYDYITDTYTTDNYYADVFYDNKPNPYFYTLEAAGIIYALDQVQLNFSTNPQSLDLVQARLLFPVNNVNRVVYRNSENAVLYEVRADYTYNNYNHPTYATVTATDALTNEISIYVVTYTYKQ